MPPRATEYQSYLIDYHTHHYRCGHAEGTMPEYAMRAIQIGLNEIGFSDHSPIYHFGTDPHPHPYTAMSQFELNAYVQEMLRLESEFGCDIVVRKGVESDYILGWDDHYTNLWSTYPVDYAIGSVHWLGEWNIFSTKLPPGRTRESILDEYVKTTEAMARSGAFDVVGHLDAIKTLGLFTSEELATRMKGTVATLAETGMVVELNTSGWRKSIGEAYPSEALLRLCCEAGVRITLGSDAHRADQVGSDFDRALRVLYRVGYREIVGFANRQPFSIPLAAPHRQSVQSLTS